MLLNASGRAFLPLGHDSIAQTTFIVLTWVFFGLCSIACTVRVYIRYVCFGRFVVEDYLMFVALALHSVVAVLIQLFARYAYNVEAVQNGDASKLGPDFYSNSKKAIVALGASINIAIVGLAIVKLNFLLFFKRIGDSFRFFVIAWWAVTVFTTASAITQIGMQQFGCFFGALSYVFSDNCSGDAALKRVFINTIVSASVDVVSDVLIVTFPAWILWGSRIDLRKKLVLSFVFGLVFLTIGITITRGSIFHQVYSSNSSGVLRAQSLTFTWFWFYCEFSVAFIIACIVSFRTLFVQHINTSGARREKQRRREESFHDGLRRDRGWVTRVRQLHDSILDTCQDLEGLPGDQHGTRTHDMRSRHPTSVVFGPMTAGLESADDANWNRSKAATGTTISNEDYTAYTNITVDWRTISPTPRAPDTAHKKDPGT